MHERIARLERDARRWRVTAMVLGATLTAALLMGQGQAVTPEVRTRRLVVVDGQGREVIGMGTDEDGPTLLVLNPTSRASLRLRPTSLYLTADKAQAVVYTADDSAAIGVSSGRENEKPTSMVNVGASLVGGTVTIFSPEDRSTMMMGDSAIHVSPESAFSVSATGAGYWTE